MISTEKNDYFFDSIEKKHYTITVIGRHIEITMKYVGWIKNTQLRFKSWSRSAWIKITNSIKHELYLWRRRK